MHPDTYRWLADVILILHTLFVLFVVVGQGVIMLGWWRGWSWTRQMGLRVAHAAAICYVMLEAWLGVVCPLTELESDWRQAAGEAGYELSFIAYWMDKLLFYSAPEWVFTLVYTLFAGLVIVTFIAYPPHRRQSRQPPKM